jgi:hypothetical protein
MMSRYVVSEISSVPMPQVGESMIYGGKQLLDESVDQIAVQQPK